MPTFNAGDTVSVKLNQGDVLNVVGTGTAAVSGNGASFESRLQGSKAIGPFLYDVSVVIACASAGSYSGTTVAADIGDTLSVPAPFVGYIRIAEGKALTVTGTAATGTVQRVDASGTALQSWTVGSGTLAPIGPFAGTQQLLITCSAGSIDASVGDAVLNVGTAKIASINLAAHIPMQPNFLANERGSSGTYHTTLEISGDVAYVQPIILVTRDPSDATYTSDDVYDAIGVAPTAAMLDANGQPNPTGGNPAWVTALSATFPRKSGASTTNPIPVAGPVIPVATIPRTDGGNGRILMLRAYSAAVGATNRMPTYTTSVADQALWDSYVPLVGQHKFYYKSGDYASTNQANFSTSGAPATRWANNCIVGLKCMFTQPHISVLVAGDSIEGGAHAQTGVPTFYGFAARAVESLRAAGYLADLTNCAVSGYSWDQFSPIANMVMPIIKPDVVIIPSYTPNGVDVAKTLGIGNTVTDAQLHWAKCLTLRDNAIAAGAKTVILLTPCPAGATGSPANPLPRALIRQWVIASGIPYVDLFAYAGADYGYLPPYRFDDYTHPNDVMNASVGASLASLIRSLLPL